MIINDLNDAKNVLDTIHLKLLSSPGISFLILPMTAPYQGSSFTMLLFFFTIASKPSSFSASTSAHNF